MEFIATDGSRLDAPPEWQSCFVEVRADDDELEELIFRCNGRPLPLSRRRVGDQFRTVAEWPRSGAGGYTLQLLRRGQSVKTATTEVAPAKLTPDGFRRLVDDLHTHLPASVALALQRAGALAGVAFVPTTPHTLSEELHRLRRACEGTATRIGLVEILHALARQHHMILSRTDVWTPRDRARRISATRLHQAFVLPGNLDDTRQPLRVPDERVEHSVDVYENRLVLAFVAQVNARLRRLAHLAPTSVSAEANKLLNRLVIARREAAFLDDVSPLTEAPERLTMVLLRRPEYRAALEGFLEFRRTTIVKLEEPRLESPLENLPFLYETWATLHAVLALVDIAPEHGYQVVLQRLVHARPGQAWVQVLRSGRAAVRLRHAASGTQINLYPQRSYQPKGQPLQSVSFTKRPDIAIEVVHSDDTVDVWLLDPKYKLESETQGQGDGTPKPVDINAMHAYRDAIRSAEGRHVVRYAATLYPGDTRVFNDGLAALQARPEQTDELTTTLRALFTRVLRSAEIHAGSDAIDHSKAVTC